MRIKIIIGEPAAQAAPLARIEEGCAGRGRSRGARAGQSGSAAIPGSVPGGEVRNVRNFKE